MFAPEIPDDFPDIPDRPWDPDDPDDDEQLINSSPQTYNFSSS